MSKKEKVTIKFWNSKSLEYERDINNLLFVNSKGIIAAHIGGHEFVNAFHIEAHFYIGDKRIG